MYFHTLNHVRFININNRFQLVVGKCEEPKCCVSVQAQGWRVCAVYVVSQVSSLWWKQSEGSCSQTGISEFICPSYSSVKRPHIQSLPLQKSNMVSGSGACDSEVHTVLLSRVWWQTVSGVEGSVVHLSWSGKAPHQSRVLRLGTSCFYLGLHLFSFSSACCWLYFMCWIRTLLTNCNCEILLFHGSLVVKLCSDCCSTESALCPLQWCSTVKNTCMTAT